MSKHHRRKTKPPRRSRHVLATVSTPELPEAYRHASRLAADGQYDEARRLYAELGAKASDVRLRALIGNDLATLDAVVGEFDVARQGLEAALAIDESCRPARLNLELLVNRLALSSEAEGKAEASAARTEPRPPGNTLGTGSALGAGLPTPPSVPTAGLLSGPALTALTAQTAPGTGPALGAGLPPPPSGPTAGLPASACPALGAGYPPPLLRVVGQDREEITAGAIRMTKLPHAAHAESPSPIRIAILSFLFNWPSTGGGNIHTVELATFLGRAGYDVRHIHVRYPEWGIGRVGDALPFRSDALEFDASSWRLNEIQARYRQAVQSFDPDYVVITDAWNMKPILAEAVEGYPYYLRFQALECLCPLNNLRLLARAPEIIEQCLRNQLANPDVCRRCLAERGHHSGSLHQWERELCRVGTPEYDRQLRRALEQAEAVLVLNPLIGALVEPYARNVRVVPWGMDPSRFPWPPNVAARAALDARRPTVGPEGEVMRPSPSAEPSSSAEVVTLFMAAVQGEFIKGYHIATEACRLLRQTRSDFELVVTFDPPGRIDEFTRSVGWCSQADLPQHYRAADICLVPTIAQEGLSRTSVEAMASGIPVVASRIGGLPFTVNDGVTGLLFEPGDPADLARQIARLLDDPGLRQQMGLAGRRRFEEEFCWESVIERYYRPLFTPGRVDRDAIHRAEAHR